MTAALVHQTSSADDTLRLGERLGRVLRGGEVLALCGPLGAGKTCLVRGVARGLGVPEDEPVTSPTFVLIREYAGRALTLLHCDAYRLSHAQELVELGLPDVWQTPETVVAIEWADRFPALLPPGCIEVEMRMGHGPDERRVRIAGLDLGAIAALQY